MAATFPALQPEEPFFGAVSRYAEAMDYPEERDLGASLFGPVGKVITAEFPGQLEQFLEYLPPRHPYTYEGLLLRHTPFPYYAPFYPGQQVDHVLKLLRRSPGLDPTMRVFPDCFGGGSTASLRFCRDCASADEAASVCGPYWRRVHLLPAVVVCPHHHVPLRQTRFSHLWFLNDERLYAVRGAPNLHNLPLDTGEECVVPEGGHGVALAMAQDTLWLLQHPQTADRLATVLERHRARLVDAGLTSSKGRLRLEAVVERVRTWAGSFGLTSWGGYRLEEQWFRSLVRGLWSNPYDGVPPFLHIMLWRSLGLTAETFFRGLPPVVIQRTPRMRVVRAPCRNPLCEEFDSKKLPPATRWELLVVVCPTCRYTYVRRTKGGRRQIKVVFGGDHWEAQLRQMLDGSASLRKTAHFLRTSERHVAREAIRLKLWPPHWPKALRGEIDRARRARWRGPDVHRRVRTTWRRETTTTVWRMEHAVSVAGKAFRFLLRFDIEWLARHVFEPGNLRSVEHPSLVSVATPDDPWVTGETRTAAAAFLRALPGLPIPVSEDSMLVVLWSRSGDSAGDSKRLSAEGLAPYADTPATYVDRCIDWAARDFALRGQVATAADVAAYARLSEAEAAASWESLEEAATLTVAVSEGARLIDPPWVPPPLTLRPAMFHEVCRLLVDKRDSIRYSFGRRDVNVPEGMMPRPGGGPRNIAERRRKGFGEGEGADYKPWETPRSVPSHGRTHRVYGHKAGRMHTLFSDRELWCWLLLEWSDMARDVREQFPLHEMAETQEIADALGYEHPTRSRTYRGRKTEEPKVLTTDFLVTLAEPVDGAHLMAISVKTRQSLREEGLRLFEKQEIERRYWERRGVPFRIATESEMPRVLVENLSLVFHYRDRSGHNVAENEIAPMLDHLYEHLADAQGVTVQRVCAMVDERLRLPRDTSARLVWYAIATRAWTVDMTVPLGPERPLLALARATRTRQIA